VVHTGAMFAGLSRMERAVQKTCKRWACCTRLVGVRVGGVSQDTHWDPYRPQSPPRGPSIADPIPAVFDAGAKGGQGEVPNCAHLNTGYDHYQLIYELRRHGSGEYMYYRYT
jgi:hypothetical protein